MYRSFLQRSEHCFSKKPLNKDYLYESVSQLYLNKPGNAYLREGLRGFNTILLP